MGESGSTWREERIGRLFAGWHNHRLARADLIDDTTPVARLVAQVSPFVSFPKSRASMQAPAARSRPSLSPGRTNAGGVQYVLGKAGAIPDNEVNDDTKAPG